MYYGGMVLPEMFGWAGSAFAVWTFLRQVLPRQYTDYIVDWIQIFLSPYSYFEVFEVENDSTNKLYGLVNRYLSSSTSHGARRSRLKLGKSTNKVTVGLSNDEYLYDSFNGISLRWEQKRSDRKVPIYQYGVGESDEKRLFELKYLRKDRVEVLGAYIMHVMEKAKSIQRDDRELRLYSNKKTRTHSYFRSSRRSSLWENIPFRHPATFDTIALDPEKKQSIIEDLDEFVQGKDFYRRVGKAWKRGYLLYGPPGTGKTTILAAMANKLHYDIYDLELTEVESNAQLRDLLVYTQSKSIIVIEDIDCSLDLAGQRKKKSKEAEPPPPLPPGQPPPKKDEAPKVTLSGLLNFTDGLWSTCEDERIFVFTTNFVNKLDPALLRSGRMDMHINLSYCTFNAFKILAKNILEIEHHALYPRVEELFNDGTRIAPSEVAEVLTRFRKSRQSAMEELIESLEKRKAKPPPPEPRPEDYKGEDDEDDKPNSPDEANIVEKAAASKPKAVIKVENSKAEPPPLEPKLEDHKAEDDGDDKSNSPNEVDVVEKAAIAAEKRQAMPPPPEPNPEGCEAEADDVDKSNPLYETDIVEKAAETKPKAAIEAEKHEASPPQPGPEPEDYRAENDKDDNSIPPNETNLVEKTAETEPKATIEAETLNG